MSPRIRLAASPAMVTPVPSRPIGPEEMLDLTGRCWRHIERSVKTLRALPDRERGWLYHQKSMMPEPLRQFSESYGTDAAQANLRARFTPKPRDVERYLEVLGWLTDLEKQNDGKRDVKILVARACGCSRRALADRFGRSVETIRRWESGAVSVIAHRNAARLREWADRDG